MDMEDGDLECPGDILPTAMAVATDTMIPGIMAVMVDIMVDIMVVLTGAVITTDTGTDIMMEADITIPLPMHMAKWIAVALTDTPGRPEAAPQVPAGRRFWIPKRQCQGPIPSQQQAVPVPTTCQLTRLLQRPHARPPRQPEAIQRQPEVMFQPPGPIHRSRGPMLLPQGVILVPNQMWLGPPGRQQQCRGPVKIQAVTTLQHTISQEPVRRLLITEVLQLLPKVQHRPDQVQLTVGPATLPALTAGRAAVPAEVAVPTVRLVEAVAAGLTVRQAEVVAAAGLTAHQAEAVAAAGLTAHQADRVARVVQAHPAAVQEVHLLQGDRLIIK